MKSNHGCVSVVIPCYNSEACIARCLDSILSQTYRNIEVICVDDGSDDGTVNIIREFTERDSRVKLILLGRTGVSAARNAGIKTARGSYIAFVDSDDFIDADVFERLVQIVRDEKVDFVRYNYVSQGGDAGELYDLKDRLVKIDAEKDILYRHFFTKHEKIPTFCWLLLIKEQIAKKVLFDEEITYIEDELYYMDLLKETKTFYSLNHAAYHYVKENGHGLLGGERHYLRQAESIILVNKAMREEMSNLGILKMVNAHHLDLLFSPLMLAGSCRAKKVFDDDKKQLLRMYMHYHKQSLAFLKRVYYFAMLHRVPLVGAVFSVLYRLTKRVSI